MLAERTPVRYGASVGENLAGDALQRVDDLEAALEPLGLAEAHRGKFYAVNYSVEGWERARLALEQQP